MQDAFGYVLFGVVVVGVVVALVTFVLSGAAYDQIGRGGLSIGAEEQAAGKPPGGAGGGAPASASARAERELEIRQLLEARNARRVARGEAPLDVDEELRRLDRPAVDPALVAEVRQLVVARNERRIARGKPPLDVEAEVARQLSELA